jgi:hypothetical protein
MRLYSSYGLLGDSEKQEVLRDYVNVSEQIFGISPGNRYLEFIQKADLWDPVTELIPGFEKETNTSIPPQSRSRDSIREQISALYQELNSWTSARNRPPQIPPACSGILSEISRIPLDNSSHGIKFGIKSAGVHLGAGPKTLSESGYRRFN